MNYGRFFAFFGLVLIFWGCSSLSQRQVASQAEPDRRGKIIITNRIQTPWEIRQVQEPIILPNPKDPTRLIMFYSAYAASGTGAIGKAWAFISDPFAWHQDSQNPIFVPSRRSSLRTPSQWDSHSLRIDSVLYIPEEDSYYIYYSGSSAMVQDQIGLAIVKTGPDGYSDITEANIVRFGLTPILSPDPEPPFYEVMSSQGAVYREWNQSTQAWDWYMYYSYRGLDGILPGIRLATSHDGKTWTRQWNENDPRKMGQIFLSTPNAYYEWHQIFKTGDSYVLSIEVGVDQGTRWRPVIAVSSRPDQGWKQLDVDTYLQTKWKGLYSDSTIYHVATPAFYPIEGKWYLFTQACGNPPSGIYLDGSWEMWGFSCNHPGPTLPGGELFCTP